MKKLSIPIIIVIILGIATRGTTNASGSMMNLNVNETDSLALVALYNATNGSNWIFNTNWLNGPVSTWHGIKVENNRVTEINLFSNRLVGTLPPEIGNLSALTSLTAHSNQLSGTLPTQIGQLVNLHTLHLASNTIVGPLPPELGLLRNLQYLYLHANRIDGEIPSALGQLNKLIYLYLYSNLLSGSMPRELANMQLLQRLYLFSNKLSGPIPREFGYMPQMRLLQLQTNELTGSIPAELGNLKLASYLYLQQNRLSGNIPPELGNMSAMQYLRLENNALSGQIPPDLSKLKSLRQLFIDMNQLSGTIPAEIGELPLLQTLSLSLNQLSGSIPAELGQLSNLLVLNLSVNQLSGQIPPELGKLTKLTQLLTDRNALSGSVPATFNRLLAIEKISLASNRLSEFLPDSLHHLPALQNIEIYYNNLTFEDFEDKTALIGRNFFYSPQNKIGQSYVVSVDTGANYTLDVFCGGSQNTYQWFFNNEAISSPQAQSNHRLLNIREDQLGHYHCKITSKIVPGLTIESENITLQFRPIGENKPTNIFLTKNSITENLPVGTEVGKLSAEDEDNDDWHIFALAEGEGDSDNGSFFIAGNQLHSKKVFIFNEQNLFHIRIETRDRAGHTFQKAFSIHVERGTELVIDDIQLSNTIFGEDIPLGSQIGFFITTDNHNSPMGSYKYELAAGEGDTDNKRFFIAANQLHSNSLFNFNLKNSFNIRVKTENTFGKTFEKTFTLTVTQTTISYPIQIPDAFSPNGDGINDLLEIKGIEYYPQAVVEIFNRQGKLVYYYKNDNPNIDDMTPLYWNGSLMPNGTQNQQILPEGYYFLVCKPEPNTIMKKTIYLKH